MKLETIQPSIFTYKYLTDPKKEQLSILIKDYFNTLPIYRLTIDGILYHLDIYDNLTMIGKTDKDIIDQGFFNIKTYEMVDIENIPYTMNKLNVKNDALLYINDKENGFEIYTVGKNMYTDQIIKGVFTRQSHTKKNTIYLPNFILSRNAMKNEQIKCIDSILKIFTQRAIVKRVCKDIDVDYLISLPFKIKKEIKEQCEKITNNWMSEYIIKILTISYDETNPIIFRINDSKLNEISRIKLDKLTFEVEADDETSTNELDKLDNEVETELEIFITDVDKLAVEVEPDN